MAELDRVLTRGERAVAGVDRLIEQYVPVQGDRARRLRRAGPYARNAVARKKARTSKAGTT